MRTTVSLDDFQLGRVLGIGTVGTIYLATDRSSGESVAVKILHPSVSGDALIRARFEREMLILQRLSHPNIIRYFGGGERDGQLFYVMELVGGGSVRDLLESFGRLSWPEVVACGRQMASALQCAHNHGIVHRDLKPANLYLTRGGLLKLGDFGIARDLTRADLTGHGLTVGTHAYMAPEQITGETAISGKADLYALGCCLYEMLSGEKPFRGDNFAQLFHQHLQMPPPRVGDVVVGCPPELDRLVAQLLEKAPERRPFNARQVQGVLIQISERYALDQAGAEGPDSQPERADVGAAEAREFGRQRLARRIRWRLGEGSPRDVSWKRLALLAALVLVGIFLGALLNR